MPSQPERQPTIRARRTGSAAARPARAGRRGAASAVAARRAWGVLLLVGLVVSAGCGEPIESRYGRRLGAGASRSVNGTAVLAGMFEQAGHRVSSWWTLSPGLAQRADCIVWFPDDFAPPREPTRRWLEEWLAARPGRTLIYVGRDFDAAGWYWRQVLPSLPPAQQAEAQRCRSDAQHEFLRRRRDLPMSADCGWFAVDGAYRPREVRTLEGDPAWLGGIDPAKLQIELVGRMLPPAWTADASGQTERFEVLLASEGDLLVARWRVPVRGEELSLWSNESTLLGTEWQVRPSAEPWNGGAEYTPEEGIAIEPSAALEPQGAPEPEGAPERPEAFAPWDAHTPWEPYAFDLGESQVIVVANGSFLLNLPLVNHEHRKLAGKLIAQLGDEPRRVVFLESARGDPPITTKEPASRPPSGLNLLIEPPTCWAFLHFAVLGALFVFSRWPIFGVPRELPGPPAADFGRHIDAVGELLRRVGDRADAVARVLHYHQITSSGEPGHKGSRRGDERRFARAPSAERGGAPRGAPRGEPRGARRAPDGATPAPDRSEPPRPMLGE